MTATVSNERIEYQLIGFDRKIDDEIGLECSKTQSHVYGRSRHVVFSLLGGTVGPMTIANNSGVWTEIARTRVRIEADLARLEYRFRSVHVPSTGGTCKVRVVEDPDGAATVRGTWTFLGSVGVTTGNVLISDGPQVIAIEVFNDDATSGTLGAFNLTTNPLL